jgi:UDP-N-acetylglucosamine 1-carboxyvinyltransferase
MKSDKIKITHSRLHDGTLKINGYKHAMVQIVAAAIALNMKVNITNAPMVDDTFVLRDIINDCGGKAEVMEHSFVIDPSDMTISEINPRLSRKIHGSLYLMPAFALRFGRFRFEEAGGCQIGDKNAKGARPVAHILDVMKRFGIDTTLSDEVLYGKNNGSNADMEIDILHYSDDSNRATGSQISGATKTAILCAAGREETVIQNPYVKTDVHDLLRFLRLAGYSVELSDERLVIRKLKDLVTRPVKLQLTGCVSEVMTYIALAVHTGINLTLGVDNVPMVLNGLKEELTLLEHMGVHIHSDDHSLSIPKVTKIKRVDIHVTNTTIQSDHHPFFALMLLRGDGESQIKEEVWRERFAYVSELQKLGAKLRQAGNVLYVTPSLLDEGGHILEAADTRAAAILILACLTVSDETVIANVHHLHRGYENLLPQLQLLGAKIETLTFA